MLLLSVYGYSSVNLQIQNGDSRCVGIRTTLGVMSHIPLMANSQEEGEKAQGGTQKSFQK
ncbi:MAG: hypothetical protein WBM86_32325 [Waterburya sp.]